MSPFSSIRQQAMVIGSALVLTGVFGFVLWTSQPQPSAAGVVPATQSNGYPGPNEIEYLPEPAFPTVPSPEEVCYNGYDELTSEEVADVRAAMEEYYNACVEDRQNLDATPVPFDFGTPMPTVDAGLAHRSAGAGEITESSGTWGLPKPYVDTNRWTAIVEDRSITVVAGWYRENFEDINSVKRGFVAVVPFTLDGERLSDENGYYELPEGSGPLRIVDTSGVILTLVADDGIVATFDVNSRELALAADQDAPQLSSAQGTIIETGETVFSIDNVDVANQWYADDGEQRITVLAGARQDNPLVGVVAVVTSNSDAPDTAVTTDVYELPVEASGLIIMDVSENQVELSDVSGGISVFDLSSRQFVSYFGD